MTLSGVVFRLRFAKLMTIAMLMLGSTTIMKAQQTTTTNCNINGNTANCTSNTTDYGAQQQQSYEAGQQVGSAIGLAIARGMQKHRRNKWVKNYCAAYPGERWEWTRNGMVIASGYCPTAQDKGVAAANKFMSKHKDYIPNANNSAALTTYLETNRLNPQEEKSYERAYKDLKKEGRLNLYSKS